MLSTTPSPSEGSKYELEGFVREGETPIHLGPRACFPLDSFLVQREKIGVGCLRQTLRLRVPTCPPSVAQLAGSIETFAHEAAHVGGIDNEAKATCYGIQDAVPLAVDHFGFTVAEARLLARYMLEFLERPPEYESKECRKGGGLDLSPGTPTWP